MPVDELEVTQDGRVTLGPKIKTQYLLKGYPTIKHRGRALKVHRLVAERYVPNPDEQTYNVLHALRTGLHPNPETPVVGTRKDGAEFWFDSQAEAARNTKALQPNINKCLSGIRKSAGQMTWRYA